MPTCIICLSDLKEPAALPCGHVFCHACIARLIRSTAPSASNHLCPTCKDPYSIANVDPQLVPHHLRSHLTPSVRKLKLEYTLPPPTNITASSPESEKLLAENNSLRTSVYIWRKRAAVHASATLGLVGLARLARDYALQMKKERDELELKYSELKTLYDQKMTVLHTPPETPSPAASSAASSSNAPQSPTRPQSPLPHLPHIADLFPPSPSPQPQLPHFAELVRGQPQEDVPLPPSLSRVRSNSVSVSSLETSSLSSPPTHRPLSPSLYRLPSPAMTEFSVSTECSECARCEEYGDCQREHKRKRGGRGDWADEDDDMEEADVTEERPFKRSHSQSPDVLQASDMVVDPFPCSAVRTITSHLEGSLSI